MFNRKNKVVLDRVIENKKQITKNTNDLMYIKDVLQNVYQKEKLAYELDELIEDLRYLNPSNKEEATLHHRKLDLLVEDVKRLFARYQLDLKEREYLKLAKKIKLEIYQRKNI